MNYGSSLAKKRNSTAGKGVTMNSTKSGSGGGWEYGIETARVLWQG
jgi:hypothetical protein